HLLNEVCRRLRSARDRRNYGHAFTDREDTSLSRRGNGPRQVWSNTMNGHLTHQELTDHLLGTRSATVEAHLASCAACSKELYQFRESLGTFRTAVHNWSQA